MKSIKCYTLLMVGLKLLTLSAVSNAQVIDGDAFLSNQADVNSFVGSSLTCSLTIEGTDIVDLTPLSTLNSVGGNLWIKNNVALTTLDGLGNLTSVGGYLKLEANITLTNLSMTSLTSVVGNLDLWMNWSLTNLNLSNLTSVGGDLEVAGNDALTNLDGLSKLTSVAGYLSINLNASLTNVDSLGKLASVGGYLLVTGNEALINLDGLNNLTACGDYLSINYNDTLLNLDGLSNLTSLGGALNIWGNGALTNLDGLRTLVSVGGDLWVQNNGTLTIFCGLNPLLSANGLDGTYNVADNLVNPTQLEISDVGPCLTPNDQTGITSLSFQEQMGTSTIGSGTISIEVANGTNLTSIVATIIVSENATISPASGIAQNFTNPVTYTVTAEDETSTQDWLIIVTEEVILGIEKNHTFSIYPNPANQQLKINLDKFSTQATISIMDFSGRILERRIVNGVNQQTFNVAMYPLGVYLIEIRDVEKQFSSRFIKN